jgi:N-acetyl-anhydromuramyl-L-alanine amidase AmpD
MQQQNEPSPLRVDRTTYRLPATQYWAASHPKEAIVLHFTAGTTASGAYQQWIQTPVRVATPYIVDRNGTIFELFSPDHWAHHLGIRNDGWQQDKRTIGIEIVNVGPLRRDARNPQQWNWWPPASRFETKYCLREETDRYVERTYRREPAFATYADAQMEAVRALVAQLCERYSIPRTIPDSVRREAFEPSYYRGFRGIAAHQNFRADKSDIGPAFDWERLL